MAEGIPRPEPMVPQWFRARLTNTLAHGSTSELRALKRLAPPRLCSRAGCLAHLECVLAEAIERALAGDEDEGGSRGGGSGG